jgi:DUF971 family protein
MNGPALPSAIDVCAAALTLHWPEGPASVPAGVLRAHCRCAGCQSARLRGMPAPVDAAATTLVGAAPVGHYALQLRFADGHDRGIFPWPALRALADAARLSPPAGTPR